ncbi:FecR domain-containing protein [Leptolyngbya sp. FACHB-321]|uniref:FecR domain-containing protein n=1 Tax=Leptolyngbya sp. FACHB-321 TaxID=2692807 RepID=UPI0016864F50|nr:FecR domain-containing protein [Leptolyngbya sp. FACHB-321]MBD2038795.1 FecR domain-containing protein [Leptolyngbya sp. FACHB-321]
MLTISKLRGVEGRPSRLLLVFVCTLWFVVVTQSSIAAQASTINQARITQVLDSPQVFIQNRQAKVNDSAKRGQRVRTGKARAQLTFNTGAIGRLAQNSVLTVGQCARLQQGTLLVNGAMNGCTASVVAGVRGTTYVLEATRGDTGIKVLEGEVVVSQRQEPNDTEPTTGNKQFSLPSALPKLPSFPKNPASKPLPKPLETIDILPTEAKQIVLKAGEKVTISATGTLGLVEKLTQGDFTSLLTGNLFNGFTNQLPGMAKIQASFQQLFPGVPFPVRLPRLPSLKLPIRLPFRLPF